MRRSRSRVPATGLALLGALAALAMAPEVARAAPVVRVKARTDIKLLPVEHREDGVAVRGEVLEQITGQPVADERVTVTMNRRTRQARTDERGIFELVFDVGRGRYDISAALADTPEYAGSQAELSGVDMEKQNVRITLHVEDPELTQDAVELTVEARTEQDVGVSIAADLYIGQDGDGEPEYLDKVRTDLRGIATYSIDRAALGELGRKRLMVKFLGDRTYNPTQAQTELVLSTATRTTFAVASSNIAYEEELEAIGRVVDERGQAIAQAPVSLKVGGRRLASELTDEGGSFRFEVPGVELGAGSAGIQVVFEPTRPWHRPSRSAVVRVTVAEPQPVPVRHTLAAFGATAMVMLAFIGLRIRPWQGWISRLRRRRKDDERDPEQDDEEAEAPQGGLTAAATSIVSNLRRPHVFELSGVVRDAVTNRRVRGAVILLAHPDMHQQREESDGRGRFRFEELIAGTWQVEVGASGYVTERFPIAVPHRGEFSGARVDLVPVRERIFAMYREVAEPRLPDREKWGIWTPRQIVDHVRAQKPSPALAALTDFVEESYFSQRTPQESILVHAAERVDAARAELAAAQS